MSCLMAWSNQSYEGCLQLVSLQETAVWNLATYSGGERGGMTEACGIRVYSECGHLLTLFWYRPRFCHKIGSALASIKLCYLWSFHWPEFLSLLSRLCSPTVIHHKWFWFCFHLPNISNILEALSYYMLNLPRSLWAEKFPMTNCSSQHQFCCFSSKATYLYFWVAKLADSRFKRLKKPRLRNSGK